MADLAKKRTLWLVAGITAAVVASVSLITQWSLTQAAVTRLLEDVTVSQVTFQRFHSTYFPPGCIAEGVTLRKEAAGSSTSTLVTIKRLTIKSTPFALLREHASYVQADGMRVFVSPTSNNRFNSRTKLSVGVLVANGAILLVGSRDPSKPPIEFEFHRAVVRNVAVNRTILFDASFSNPEPRGEITASGKFGPWVLSNSAETPVSGQYSFAKADLSAFPGIAGSLSSSGSFHGPLNKILVDGTADIPNLKVSSSAHLSHLQTRFSAMVDAKTGDVALQNTTSLVGRTGIAAQGRIAGQPSRTAKTLDLDLESRSGRIQDLLVLFIREPRSPLSGNVAFRAHATLPPGGTSLYNRVLLDGDFGISASQFTQPYTQENIDKLSAEARGEHDAKDNSGLVLSDLKGHVELKDGVAVFTKLSCSIPGALARLQGTYNLNSENIDLHGTLKMDSSVGNMAQGVKGILFKVAAPFFKHNARGGSDVPIKISGTYDHPSFGLDLTGNKKNNTEKQLERLYTNRSH